MPIPDDRSRLEEAIIDPIVIQGRRFRASINCVVISNELWVGHTNLPREAYFTATNVHQITSIRRRTHRGDVGRRTAAVNANRGDTLDGTQHCHVHPARIREPPVHDIRRLHGLPWLRDRASGLIQVCKDTWREACKCIGGQPHDLEIGAFPRVRNLKRSRRRAAPVIIRKPRSGCLTACTTGQDEYKANPWAAVASHSGCSIRCKVRHESDRCHYDWSIRSAVPAGEIAWALLRPERQAKNLPTAYLDPLPNIHATYTQNSPPSLTGYPKTGPSFG